VFRSHMDLEALAQAHRDDLLPHQSVSTSGRTNGPLSRTRRAMGLGLIALGERLTDRSARPAPSSPYFLHPADGRAR
jgi:hypothetical protein